MCRLNRFRTLYPKRNILFIERCYFCIIITTSILSLSLKALHQESLCLERLGSLDFIQDIKWNSYILSVAKFAEKIVGRLNFPSILVLQDQQWIIADISRQELTSPYFSMWPYGYGVISNPPTDFRRKRLTLLHHFHDIISFFDSTTPNYCNWNPICYVHKDESSDFRRIHLVRLNSTQTASYQMLLL